MTRRMDCVVLYVACVAILFQTVGTVAEERKPEMITIENNDYYGFMDKFEGFRCQATGTNLKYSWKHSDIVINDKYILKFPNTNSSDLAPLKVNINPDYEGFYQCFVENSIGKIFGRRGSVKFTILGTFVKKAKGTKEETIDVTVGKPFTLNCPEHEPSQKVKYTWVYKRGTIEVPLPESKNYFVGNNGTLYFSILRTEDINLVNDKGGIICKQNANVPGEQSRSDTSHKIKMRKTATSSIPKNVKPEIKTIIDNHDIEIGTEELGLECGAVGYPIPTLTWYRIDSTTNSKTEIKPGTPDYSLDSFNQYLAIKNVDAEKAGKYMCEAKNIVGEDSAISNVKVAEFPQWTKDGEISDKEPALYGSLKWKCAAFGGPRYLWFKNGVGLNDRSADGKIVIERKDSVSFLIIKNVTRENNGMYQCTAANELDTIYASARLQVKEKKPQFTELMGPVTLIRSRTGIIVCPVVASPAPEITWKKGDLIVLRVGKNDQLNSKRLRVASNNRDLLIPNVTDSDAGVYTCIAENRKGRAQNSSTVSVGADITWKNAPVDNRNVTITLRYELDCEAEGDPSYEVSYRWLRNGLPLEYSARIHWVKDEHRLVILDALVSDTGTYTCIASAETPLYIEKRKDADIVVKAPANPPDIVWISSGSCWDADAQLSWKAGALNNEEVYEYWIDWATSYNPSNWTRLPKVLEEDPKPVILDFKLLPPFSQISFRVTVFNRIGAGEPSVPTDPSDCITKPAAPPFSPKEIKGVPGGPNTLKLEWTPVPQTFWGAPAFNYTLQWRRKTNDESPNRWNNVPVVRIYDGNNNSVTIENPGYYNEWEFRIRSNNAEGSAPKWTEGSSFSGQDAPETAPSGLAPDRITARSADISWQRVSAPKNGSIDGYKVEYWHSAIGMDVDYNRGPNQRAKREINRVVEYRSLAKRDIASQNVPRARVKREDLDEDEEVEEELDYCFNPKKPCKQESPEKESQLKELRPYKVYHVKIAAYNSGGVGPWSKELVFPTAEAPPGPPYAVLTYPYDKYCKLTWKEPRHKNGKILEYMIYGRQIVRTKVPWWMRRHIIYDLKTGGKYEAKIRARTSSGWGAPVFRWFQTHEEASKPVKPLVPEVVGYGEDGVNVTFMEPKREVLRKFGGELDEDPWEYREVGGYPNENRGKGGYPERFYVVYRRKGTNDTLKKTIEKQMWGPRDQTWIVIENLTPDTVYEFATVPVNAEGEGPQSDFAQGLTGGIVPRVEKLYWYQRDWFIALVVLFCAAILLFVVILGTTNHLKDIYYEGAPKRRKDRERERIYEPEDVDGGFNEFTLKSARSSRSVVTSRSEAPPPYNSVVGSSSRHSGDFDDDEDATDSDDEKNEVNTYYSDEKKVPLDDLDDDDEEDSGLATFV